MQCTRCTGLTAYLIAGFAEAGKGGRQKKKKLGIPESRRAKREALPDVREIQILKLFVSSNCYYYMFIPGEASDYHEDEEKK